MFENGIGPPVVEIPRNKRRPPQRRPPNHAQFNVVEAQYELEFTTWTTAAAPPNRLALHAARSSMVSF